MTEDHGKRAGTTTDRDDDGPAGHGSSGETPESRPARGPLSLDEREKLWREIHRTRFFLSFALLPPLLFFIFLVLWFREGAILIPVGLGLYAYMLAQFFIFRNPARLSRRRERAGGGSDRS